MESEGTDGILRGCRFTKGCFASFGKAAAIFIAAREFTIDLQVSVLYAPIVSAAFIFLLYLKGCKMRQPGREKDARGCNR